MSQIAKAVLLNLLRAYKWVLSPILPPACRYVPTCSEYAMEAVERHGAIRGSALAAWRLLRCHPFTQGGFDPVPIASCSANKMIPSGCSHTIPTAPESHA